MFDGAEVVVVMAGVPFMSQQLAVHHITRQLARRVAVLYVEPGEKRASLRPRDSVRLEEANLAVFTPKVPLGQTRPLVRTVVRAALGPQVRRCLAHTGGRVSAVVVGPPQRAPMVSFPGVAHIHYATDDFVSGAGLMGLSSSWVRRCESRLSRGIDLVVAVSEPIAERWRSEGVAAEVLPNGCDVDLFASTPSAVSAPDVRLAPPVAVVAGTLSDRLDVELLRAVAQRMSVLLVGHRSRSSPNPALDSLLELDSVQWVGPQPFAAMPSYLAAADVGLVPYVETTFNRASFPLKTLEYLAAGLPVVSTDLPSVHALGTDLIEVASNSQEFAEKALASATGGRSAESVERRLQFASQHSWAARGERFAELVGVG